MARELSGGWFDPWAMPGGVDPTGYVKGWAAQRALARSPAGDVGRHGERGRRHRRYRRPGAGHAFPGRHRRPRSTARLACVVELTGAIATSGTYERGDHLIDPRYRAARHRVASASVTGPDLGLADALATALAVAGPRWPGPMIEALAGYEAFVIAPDGAAAGQKEFPFAPREAAPPHQAAPGHAALHRTDLARSKRSQTRPK